MKIPRENNRNTSGYAEIYRSVYYIEIPRRKVVMLKV